MRRLDNSIRDFITKNYECGTMYQNYIVSLETGGADVLN